MGRAGSAGFSWPASARAGLLCGICGRCLFDE